MRKTRLIPIQLLLLLLIGNTVAAQQLVHYWTFNDNSSVANLLTPRISLVTGASITHITGGTSTIDAAGGTGQNFSVTNPNIRNADTSGTHLRFNTPIGGELVFALPTTGYKDPVVKFATRRSGSGAGLQYWAYTTDGTNYVPFDTISPVDNDPVLETLDFSAVTAADNNPSFKIKVSFAAGAGGTGGNNRFDNFTLDANTLPVLALVHYWNFNNNSTVTNLLTPDVSLVTGAAITHITGGSSAIDVSGGTGQNFSVLNYNARNSDVSGTHLRFNDPIGGQLEFALPTTGYEDITVKFATRRSGSGAGTQYWSYSTNGTTYVPFDTIAPFNGDPLLETLDFTNLATVDNNPNFKLRVSFDVGSGGTGGNNRFDNYTLDGYSIGGVDTTAPMTAFAPLNNAVNIDVNVNPTITFNEPVRLINNSAVTNANAASLVELRLNNAAGAVVPFTATYAANTITIIPVSALQNNQQYYVALKANMVEDNNDNAIATLRSAQFTTIALQTQFSAGDIVPIAYRMNATNTEDEVALLTLVDILPGTFINLTDAKYTSNAQPQCPGGIVWTAPANECIPAGTVIAIQTDALIANKGTVTGSGFGLSSGGDQVIIYTGTPAAPNHITALTANGWATTNTSCSGSSSLIPATLTDGTNAANLSTAPGNVSGLSVNAYYNGTQTGTPAQLRTAILNPANWVVAGAGTAPQTWPVFNFPAPPTVTNAAVTSSTTIRLVFNSDLNATTAGNISNYTGITGLTSATVTSNGAAIDTVTLTFSTPFSNGISYSLSVDNIQNAANRPMACEYRFNFTYTTRISFASTFVVAQENAGTLNFVLNIVNPGVCKVDLGVLGYPFSTTSANDFTLATQTLNITGTSTTVNVAIPIIDDNNVEQAAEYFALVLRNPVDALITGDTLATIYIKDNDVAAPAAAKDIELQYVGSFDPSGSSNSTCEVVVYDSASKRLFTNSAVEGRLEIINFSNPAAPSVVKSVDMKPYGGITSVAVKNGIVAVASPDSVEQKDGKVIFFDVDGVFQKQVTVGALPDMVTFTPDGKKVLTANEGQPSADYTVDPEGSVSIIDISGGVASLTQANVKTLDFTAFNNAEAVYIAAGIRKTWATGTLSQDLEPEYITVHSSSAKAWVTLQENNAIGEIDLQNGTIIDIWPLGTKNFNLPGNGFDASDNNNEILIANWPIKAYYIPDAMATYNVGGVNYLVTANEGDEKEYDALEERTTITNAAYILDSARFPHAAMLKKNHNLGRMRITNLNGDIDNDGDFDEIYCVGTRSFSIWNADTKSLVYDSGDDFELYTSTAPSINPLFNSDHEDNSLKGRSRSKGPEPEGVTIAELSGNKYAFVSLERVGGVMVYDITNPATPAFMDYKNNRSVSAYTGDHGPETLVFIPGISKTDKNYLVVANEISGTLTVFEVIDNNPNGITGIDKKQATFNIFPNPANGSIVYFNRMADVQVMDIMGKVVYKGENVLTLNVNNYAAGVYMVQTTDGATARMVIVK